MVYLVFGGNVRPPVQEEADSSAGRMTNSDVQDGHVILYRTQIL